MKQLSKWVDPIRCWQLFSGVAGIYISYLITGYLQERMILNNYSLIKDVEEKFKWPAGFLIFPCAITYLIGTVINYFTIKKQDRVHIPQQNSAICGITVAISTLTYTYAIYLTNFPVVMMVKSCNILSVILVGVCCSRVKEHKLKLGKKKIAVGVLVTVGIVLFKYFDPASENKEKKKTEMMGIVLLIVSLLADGFLPDFQAVIKSVYKPQPMEMMVQINKWVSIISLIYSLLLFEFNHMIQFIIDHEYFLLDMFLMGLLSTIGQMFVYRMIKQFKQHFPPFVITTRKIFTVGLSIFIFNHKTNFIQISGLLLVFGIVTYQFVSELMAQKKNEHTVVGHVQEAHNLKQPQLTHSQLEVEPQSRYDPTNEIQSSTVDEEKKKYEQRLTNETLSPCCHGKNHEKGKQREIEDK